MRNLVQCSIGAIVGLVSLSTGGSALVVEGEFSPNVEFPEPPIDIKKSTEQLWNNIKSILGQDYEDENSNCISLERKCKQGHEFTPCCGNLFCLYNFKENEYFCQCPSGSEANAEGVCSFPEYPSFWTAVIWVLIAIGVMISCSYLAMSCLKKKPRRDSAFLNDDANYSTFGAPSAPTHHHITSVFTPVVSSQVIERPPTYQMEEMPPSYEDAIQIEQRKI